MKPKFFILFSATVLSCAALPLLADPMSDSSQPDRDAAQMQGTPRLGELRRANRIIGSEIQDSQGQKIGKVKDLALDLQNGRIAEVIVATGGALGMDEKIAAVPPESFICGSEKRVLQLKGVSAQIETAPKFEITRWADATQSPQVIVVYQHAGLEPYFKDDAMNPQKQNSGQGGQDSQYYHFNGDNALPHLGYVARASSLRGTMAWNMQNEKLARVSDFIVDLPAGRIVEVILAQGGFLGMGNEYSAVPPESFHWNADSTALTLDTTREALKTSPHFKSSEWSQATDPSRISEVYSSYHVRPYFGAMEMGQGAQNVRERTYNTPSSSEQRNNADLDTSEQIHKNLMADTSLSAEARNVKILTSDGKVTLTGVVNTEDEKRLVGEAAAKIAGADKVDNRLDVRPPSPTSPLGTMPPAPENP